MLKPTKITIFLLIALLLTTSMVNAFGIIACENGCLSEIHNNNHAGKHNDELPDDSPLSYNQHFNGNDDSCRDYLLQLSDGLFKKIESINLPINITISSMFNTFPNFENFCTCKSNSYLKSSQIISQTIHASRTVVLLNWCFSSKSFDALQASLRFHHSANLYVQLNS